MHRSKFLASLLAAVAVCWTAATAQASAEAPVAPARFTVQVEGEGPDVILIPGLASSAAVWDDTVHRLSGRYRLHVIQVSGFAGSPPGANADGPILAPLVEALHEQIERDHMKHPAVIGHSLGGLIGLMLAHSHPGDVGKLMVVDVMPFYAAILRPDLTAETAQPMATRTRDFIRTMPADAFAASETQTAARLSKSPSGRALVAAWGAASNQAVAAQATYDDLTTDARPYLATIKIPVTVVYAWDAAMGPVERTDALYASGYANLPAKRVVRVDDTFHFIPLDQPDAFARQVEDFLRR